MSATRHHFAAAVAAVAVMLVTFVPVVSVPPAQTQAAMMAPTIA